MKQKIVPTSPKSPHKQQREENRAYRVREARRPHVIFVLLFSSLVIGACAGFAGFFVAANVPPDWPVIGQYNVSELFQSQKETVFLSSAEQEKSVVEEAPQVIEQTLSLYDTLPRTDVTATLLGNAVALTTDGWIVAPAGSFTKDPKDTIVLMEDGTAATVLESQTDEGTGLIYAKIDANDLSPVEFTDGTELRTGQWVSVVQKSVDGYGVYERRVASNPTSVVRTTNAISTTYELDTFSEQQTPGAGVYASGGQLLGLITADGRLLHASSVSGQLQALLDTTALATIADDIQYVQLSGVTAAEREENGLPESGIWVVNAGTIGKESGLQANDVIVSINNVVVTDTTDLGTALRSRAAGATFLLGVQRADVLNTFDYTTTPLAK